MSLLIYVKMNNNLKKLKEAFEKFQIIDKETSQGLEMVKMENYVREVEKLDLDKLLLENVYLKIDDATAVMLGHYYSSQEKLKSLVRAGEGSQLTQDYKGLEWKGMPVIEIYEHFKVMTERRNKIEIPFLTTKQLALFIEHVFINNSKVPKAIKVSFGKGERGFVVKRFYQFYVLAYNYTKINSKHDFIKMVADNFQDFEFGKVKNQFYGHVCKIPWK